MLLSLTVDNFRSFGSASTLDLQRRAFTTQRPRTGETWREVTWRRAAIFGANASGKSNALKPLGLLKNAVSQSLRNDEWVKILRNPHLLQQDESTSFEVDYTSNDVRFRWSLTLDDYGVVAETLLANPKLRWQKVFDRNRSELTFGANSGISQAARENIEQFMQPWTLVFSAWATVKTPGHYSSALDWWSRVLPLIVGGDADQDNRHRWLVQLAKENPNWLAALRAVVAVADVGINDIDIEEHAPEALHSIHIKLQSDGDGEISHEMKSSEIDEYLRYILFEHRGYDRSFSLPESEESQGTRTWMDLAIPALFALLVGGVLAVDEIDGSLHPLLVRELVALFDDERLNPLGAQLLFSTHDTTLLGRHPAEVLNRGEVWFVEKNNSFSELFALDEFRIREAHNIERRYLQGKYGALPLANAEALLPILNTLRTRYLDSSPNK